MLHAPPNKLYSGLGLRILQSTIAKRHPTPPGGPALGSVPVRERRRDNQDRILTKLISGPNSVDGLARCGTRLQPAAGRCTDPVSTEHLDTHRSISVSDR